MNCEICGKPTRKKKPKPGRKHVFCSNICQGVFLSKPKENRQCLSCGALTTNPKFCSRACSARINNLGRVVIRHCLLCGSILENGHIKYCSKEHKEIGKWKIIADGIEASGIARSEKIAKKYLLIVRGHRCEICHNAEWMGRPIPVVLDHINGDSRNNSISNLRIICCNCDAQTPTYKALNRGHGRIRRRVSNGPVAQSGRAIGLHPIG